MRAAVLVLLVSLAPTAGACSWFTPDLLNAISWHPALGIVGTTELFWTGPVDLENGTVRSRFPDGAVVSPDGRFVAFPRIGPDVQTGPILLEDTCGFHRSRHLVGWDTATDALVIVDEGPIWSMDARDDGVVTHREHGMRIYRWGSWDAIEEVERPTGAKALAWRDRVPDATARALDERGVYAFASARSPDGEHVALHAEENGTYELRVYRARDLSIVARMPLASDRALLAWSEAGLAILLTPSFSDHPTPTLRVYREPLALASAQERAFVGERAGGLAWSPADDALALSFPRNATLARVVVLDATLDVEQDASIELVGTGRLPPGLDALPVPQYSLVEQVRETPASGIAALTLALVLAAPLSRRARDTSRGSRP